jgi:hypothetical protein
MVDDGIYYFSSYRTERDVMKYWMNIIRKSGGTELVLNVKGLPEKLQQQLKVAGLGVDETGGVLGMYHQEDKTVYIFLTEVVRFIKGQKPEIDLNSPRMERLIINRILATIEHENLHRVMDDSIKEFMENYTDYFVSEVVTPVVAEFLDSIEVDSIESFTSRIQSEAISVAITPSVRNLLYNSGQNLLHEIMVRMMLQYDNNRVIKEITPYILQYIPMMLGDLAATLGFVPDELRTDENIQGILNLMIDAIPHFWSTLLRNTFLNNFDEVNKFMRTHLRQVLNVE